MADGGSGRKGGKKEQCEEERKRDGEKEENETVSAKRGCVGLFQQALGCVGGKSRRDDSRRDDSESASGDQKKDDAAHATAELAPVD